MDNDGLFTELEVGCYLETSNHVLIIFIMGKERKVLINNIYIWCFNRANFPKLREIMSEIYTEKCE